MSKQPPNNDQPFDADLAAIENAMNNIMQGAFSMMFRQLTDTNIFESVELPRVSDDNKATNFTTTILNGNNLNSSAAIHEEDGYGGNDFKRLTKKSKQNRGILPAEEVVSNEPQSAQPISSAATSAPPVGAIFNLLFQQPAVVAELFNKSLPSVEDNTKISNNNHSTSNDKVKKNFKN